jgi:tRNA 2-thiouridine synthesizing protein A
MLQCGSNKPHLNMNMDFFGWACMAAKIDKKLDTVGLFCPEPVFRTRLELDDMEIGQTLEVVADDPAAESDIQSLVKYLEQELIYSSKEGSNIRILIKKIK